MNVPSYEYVHKYAEILTFKGWFYGMWIIVLILISLNIKEKFAIPMF